jgi:hypothetical protein
VTVYWLQPWAWWGLAAVALPILVHLLARHRVREMAFPTLRFVRATQLAALRRRVLSDVPLLLVRMAIVAAAVAALAAPTVVSSSRQQEWARRTSRAIVHLSREAGAAGAEESAVIAGEQASAFASRVFVAQRSAADAIAEAGVWLDQQPPSAREVVVVGDLLAGAITSADVARLSPGVGLRFLPTPHATEPRPIDLTVVLDRGDAGIASHVVRTLVDDDTTRVVYQAGSPGDAPASMVTVRAAASERDAAAAARDAVFAEGVRLPRDGRRPLEIEFAGAEPVPVTRPSADWMLRALGQLPGLAAGERDGRLVVRAAVRASDPAAARVMAHLVRAAWADPLDDRETRRIGAATLAAWARPSAGVSPGALPGNEGDARWLWLAALALLALESWMRRARSAAAVTARAAIDPEARVA